MEILNDKEEKVQIDYPCLWSYKVISITKESIKEAITDIILQREHKLTHSNKSKSGKYVSMNLDILVEHEDERNFIFESLKKHKNIKMVL